MPPTEAEAREDIDELLTAAGWSVCDPAAANITAHRGVAIREFPLKQGHGYADYMLYVDGRAAGVVEAKKAGATLVGVETQSAKYTAGLPDALPAWRNPLPFAYESTGVETRFTNGLDVAPRSRPTFAFHTPDTLADWLSDAAAANQTHSNVSAETSRVAEAAPEYVTRGPTFRARMQHMPELVEDGLWPAQVTAIKNLEVSLADNRPRALIQMATGSGKTFTAISFIYRLIKFAGARRILFLVDRGNLGDQTLKEFQQYASPYNNFKFTEEYIVQRLTSNTLDKTARVCISTIQRMYSMLKGQELPEDLEEESADKLGGLFKKPEPLEYNPSIPIESFDIIVTDECHRSIYNLWAQVLEYFDAYLIGLTATPSKQTFGFFNQNLVMEYNHEMAVADGVNVNYDVYRIRTKISEAGSKVEAGYSVQIQERDTRKKRWEELDDDFSYDPNQLDRDVVAPDQIRKIIQTYRDKLFTEIFPGREWVPKTLIFAKDDAHAENIVEIVREEFGKGNDFAQKITYRTTGAKPKDLINEFRTSPMPRVAVTVDMIATGTDIKAVEVVMFMRAVKSRAFFEQMKGRGVRVIRPDDLQSVTPDAKVKDHFVIVDAVGVCEQDKTDSRPMEQKPTVSFEKLMQAVAFGNTEDDVLSSLAGRLARMEHRLTPEDDKKIRALSGGLGVKGLSHRIVAALDPDRHVEQAMWDLGIAPDDDQPIPDQALKAARQKIILEAVKPLHDPKLREAIGEIKKKNEVVIDIISADEILEATFSADALDRAKGMVQSFEQFIQEHKDEITALQVLYSKPYKQRLTFDAVKELADAIEKPPYLWNESQLWNAYAALEKSKVKGASGRRILTDLVSLVRFAIHRDNELIPFPERVNANFRAWLASQESSGKEFTEEQRRWLEMIRDHIAANLGIDPDDFEYAPFSQHGGLGKVHQLFGDKLNTIIEQFERDVGGMSTRDNTSIAEEIGLPRGWEWSTLGDVSEKPQYGWTTKANHDAGELKLLRTTDITSGSVDWSSVPFCTEEPEDVEKYLVESGDILISRAGSVGVSFLINKPERAVFASYLIRFRPKSSIGTKYFYYYLKSSAYWEAIGASKSGIAVPNVNASKLAQVPIPVAPLDQQERIVAEIEKQFSRLDEAVANLKRVKANLKRYKAAVLKAAVEGRLVETEAELAHREGRRYETGAQLLQRVLETRRSQWQGKGKYKEPVAPDITDLPELPEGWVWTTLDQLSGHADNAICAGPFGTIFKAKDFRPNGVPIIFLRHVSPGKYLTHKPGFMDEDKWHELFQPYSVFGGELLVTKLGEPPGACAIYPEGIGPAMVTPDVIKMTVNNSASLSSYLMHYLNSDVARQFSSGAAFGTTRLRLTIPIFRAMAVALPPIAEQRRITDEVDRRFSLVEEAGRQLAANNRRAERLIQSILNAAFSGALIHGRDICRRNPSGAEITYA